MAEGRLWIRKVIFFGISFLKHRSIPVSADKIHMLGANDTYMRGKSAGGVRNVNIRGGKRRGKGRRVGEEDGGKMRVGSREEGKKGEEEKEEGGKRGEG